MKTEDMGGVSLTGLGDPIDRLTPDRVWPDLVLPEAQTDGIRTICAAFREHHQARPSGGGAAVNGAGAGLIVLFVGEAGTGKTTAARVLGSELGLGILRLDLSRLPLDDLQEAGRSLQRALSLARESGDILFLDKAETMFGKRQPLTGRRRARHPEVPADVLTGRLEGHRGLIVVSAQLKARVDDRLLQSVRHEVDFPFPQAAARERIWRLRLPPTALIDDARLEFLAASFKLSGGAIERCTAFAEGEATAAGVPVDMRHIVLALEREYGRRPMGPQTQAAFAGARELIGSPQPPAAEPPTPQPATAQPPTPEPPTLEPVTAEPTIVWPTPRPEPRAPARPEPRAPARPEPTRRPEPRRTRQPKPSPKPDRRTRWLAQLTVAGVVVAAVLGFLLARALAGSGSSPAPLNQHATVGLLQVSYPAGWRRQTPPATPALGLTDELALAPSHSAGGVLVIGRAAQAAPNVLLPPSLLNATGALGPAQVTTLGGAHYYRYLDQTVRGLTGRASLYVLPAGAGTIFGLCEQRGSAPAFAASCERIVGTVRPVSGGLLRVSLSPTYASGLTAAMARFSAARSTAATALARARTPAAQATAAAALASAHFAAATAVRRLSAGGASAQNLALAAALRQAGDAYQALGRAAAGNDASAYAAARSQVSAAAARLSAAFTQLDKVGYVAG